MNSASATTITVDDAIFTVGDVIQVANKGAMALARSRQVQA
jgi:hypothetical protein